jgi:hypothetical protein
MAFTPACSARLGKTVGHEDETVTQRHYEGALPEGALAALKQLEAKGLSKLELVRR